MFTIFDLMRPGAGMDAMARQFGLTQDQAQRATEALLPAFMLGLQRSAGNPNAFANLMGAAAPSTSQPQAAAPTTPTGRPITCICFPIRAGCSTAMRWRPTSCAPPIRARAA